MNWMKEWMTRHWHMNEKGEFGIGPIISLAVALIIAAFVLIPGFKDFSEMVLNDMDIWWNNTVSEVVFPLE